MNLGTWAFGLVESLGVDSLTFEELDAESALFDAEVLRSDDLDRFCSSSDWVLPAARTLMPPTDAWIRRHEHGWLALVRHTESRHTVLQPLESLWGLACPLVGGEPGLVSLALDAARILDAEARADVLALSGLVPQSPRFLALARALDRRRELRLGPLTRRRAASLAGGLDGFLARRSSGFRTSLRRAQRRAVERGVKIGAVAVDPASVDGLYARILAVEERSWKGKEGVGFACTDLLSFYREMLPRLARRGALRARIATNVDGEDIGFIFGGILGDTYRGLQFSFVDAYDDCSLGNLLQTEMVGALADEQVAIYDLGTDVEYKRRWGEITTDTVLLVGMPVR